MPTIAETWKEEGRLEGIQKGIQKGRIEEVQENLLDLLQERFGTLPEGIRQRIQQADHASLRRWLRQLLRANTLEDVFRDAS